MLFKDLGFSIMLAEFSFGRDKEHVRREVPWSFDKCLVLIRVVYGKQQAHQMEFTKALFWVCLHDLPLRAQSEYMGRQIGGSIGEVVKVDFEEDNYAWGEFMRVWVNIDISKPLLLGKNVNVGVDKPCWIWFSYERLPNYCYQCGRIDHGYRDCMHGAQTTNMLTGDDLEKFSYGQWLRASNGSSKNW